MKHPWVMGIQVYSNEGQHLSAWEDNSKIILVHLKIVFSRTIRVISGWKLLNSVSILETVRKLHSIPQINLYFKAHIFCEHGQGFALIANFCFAAY
jgi:hypothetical protein